MIPMSLLILLAVLLALSIYLIYLETSKQEIRDAEGDLYMVRYFIWGGRPDRNPGKANRKIYLHHFIRSDYDRALHDHPWSFTSVLLTGGYREFVDFRDVEKFKYTELMHWHVADNHTDYRDFKPLSIIRRPAQWRHRVELYPGKKAWTLVFIGRKQRSWGFWINFDKFCPWKRYDQHLGICEGEPQ